MRGKTVYELSRGPLSDDYEVRRAKRDGRDPRKGSGETRWTMRDACVIYQLFLNPLIALSAASLPVRIEIGSPDGL